MGDSTTIVLNLTFAGTLALALLMFLCLFLLVVATLVLTGVGRLVALSVMALFGRLPRNETIPLVRLTGPAESPVSGPASVPSVSGPDGAAPASGTPLRARVLRARVLRAGELRARAAAQGAKAGAALSALRAPRDWRTLLKPAELGLRCRAAVGHHPLVTAARREPPVLAADWAAAVAEADARAMARARAAAPEIAVPVLDLPGPALPAGTLLAVAPLVESALHRDHQDHPARDEPRSFTKPAAPAPLSLLDTGSLVSLSGHAKVLKAKLPADRR